MSGASVRRAPGGGSVPLWGLVLAAAASAVTFLRIRDVGLMGFDSFPMILTARVRSAADVLAAFTDQMMDDRFRGAFYRPLVSLSFAADEGLWGLDPMGYQLTAALLFGFAGWAVLVFAHRLAPTLRVAPWVASAAFWLHPLAIEVVPVPARRAELLACAFLALACAWVVEPRLVRGRRWVAAAACGALAMSAKEVALLAALPAFVIGASAEAGPRGAMTRWRFGLTCAFPLVAAAVVMGLARFLVLGGLGGYEVSSPLSAPLRLPAMLTNTVTLLVAPQPGLRGAGFAVLAALSAVAVLLGARGLDAGRRRPLARVGLVALSWLAMAVAAFAAAGTVQAWYMAVPAVAWALVVALAVEIVVVHRSGRRRWQALAGLAVLLLTLTAHARYSFWWTEYGQWKEATRASEEFFADLDDRIARAPAGDAVTAPQLPRWVRVPAARPWVWGAAVLDAYSIQAWLELTLPERRFCVVRAGESSSCQGASTTVVVESLREGFEAPFPPRR